ncbi:MAG: response regulator transcription factor [Dehalococcoidia bacterium]|nr:MAG: response regulator transcription factor [Dehalococcoidia bacterium]
MDITSVFIVDRQTIYRQGVRQALSADDSISVVGDCPPGSEALTLVEAFAPNVVLLDVDLPLLRGLDIGRQITTRCPQSALICLTSSPDDDQLFQAIRSGAAAYLSKEISAEELAHAIKRIKKGDRPINETLLTRPRAAEHVLRQFQDLSLMGKAMETLATPLTPRETETLKYVAEGYSNKQIAHVLGISEQTIKNHITSILDKLDANDRTHAVVLALRQGWIDINESALKS